jgi:hypothetical protein
MPLTPTDSDVVNYRGELFLYGKSKAPFLNAISGRAARAYARTFPLASPWTLSAASQNTQSEDTSAAEGTATTISRGQDTNITQIMKYDVATTFVKQSLSGDFTGVNSLDGSEVLDELGFQKKGALMQMASDMEYSFLQGAYTGAGTSATNCKTRGLNAACTTNTVAAGGKKLEKSMIEELVLKMVDSGAPFANVVMLVNTFNAYQLSDIYGYAPMDRTMGGVAIDQFLVPGAGTIRVLYSPQQAAATVTLADLSVIRPVFNPINYAPDGNVEPKIERAYGVEVLWQPTSIVAAARGGFFMSVVGLDYGPEEYHGTITGLATSA